MQGHFDVNMYDISELPTIKKHIRHFNRNNFKWSFKDEKVKHTDEPPPQQIITSSNGRQEELTPQLERMIQHDMKHLGFARDEAIDSILDF